MAPIFVLFLFFLISSTTAAQCNEKCNLHKSKAAYFPISKPLSAGACGYGNVAKGFYNGYIAAGVPSLFANDFPCGSCLQVTCKNKALCRGSGTKVVLTDSHNGSNKTELVLSDRAYISMASKGKARELLKLGYVDVEYRRIPCEYKNHNVSVRVNESSKKPNKLELTFLYQDGEFELETVEAYQWGAFSTSGSFANKYGAVWELSPVPELYSMNLMLTYRGYEVIHSTNDLPNEWKVGEIYDLGYKIKDAVRKI